MFSLPRYLARSQRDSSHHPHHVYSSLKRQMAGRGYSVPASGGVAEPALLEVASNGTSSSSAATNLPSSSSLVSEFGQSISEVKWYEHLTAYKQLIGGDLVYYEYPIKVGQVGLESLQYGTGLSWWAIILVSSIILRILLSPLQIKSLRVSAYLQKIAPEVREASSMAQARHQQRIAAGLPTDGMGTFGITRSIYAKYGVSPFSSMKYLAPQAPFLVLLFVSLRNMCFDPAFAEQLSYGGALWFHDLTIPDPYYILPILCSVSLIVFFELQNKMNGMEAGLFLRWVPRIFAVGLLAVFSFMPAGVAWYIFTSSSLMFAITGIFWFPRVRRYWNIPLLKEPTVKLTYEDIRAAQTVTAVPQKEINPNSLRMKKK